MVDSVDVVVPTYRRADLVKRCLEHLARQTLEHRVIVVDDASGDDTAEVIAAHDPTAEVVRLERNRGFGAAVNAGVQAGSGEAVVLVNNDVFASPSFLERIVAPLSAPATGMVAALLLQADGRRIDSLGLEVDRTLAAFPRLWGGDVADAVTADSQGLLGPTGGAAAYRRRALEDVRGFDERVGDYNEDTDLALRLREAGWECAAAVDATAIHLGSASFGRHSRRQVYSRGRSRAFLLRKYRVLKEPRRALATMLVEGGIVGWQLIRTRELAGLRGRVSGWRSARPERPFPSAAVNGGISLRESIARRRRFRA
ncbi:MAG: glycosyltransferase family 2 protein [Solirubrobacterales bacterium]